MSTTGQNIINQINRWVRNYAVEAFHNLRLNAILLQLVGWIDNIVLSGGGGGTLASVVPVTSADFINATDCPLVALDGMNLEIFWDDRQNYLKADLGEVELLTGGGFRVLIAGFDALAVGTNIRMYVYPR